MESLLLGRIRRIALWTGVIAILISALLVVLWVWDVIDMGDVGLNGVSVSNWGKTLATSYLLANVSFSVLLTMLVAGYVKTKSKGDKDSKEVKA